MTYNTESFSLPGGEDFLVYGLLFIGYCLLVEIGDIELLT
jgi:hypothetical protein